MIIALVYDRQFLLPALPLFFSRFGRPTERVSPVVRLIKSRGRTSRLIAFRTTKKKRWKREKKTHLFFFSFFFAFPLTPKWKTGPEDPQIGNETKICLRKSIEPKLAFQLRDKKLRRPKRVGNSGNEPQPTAWHGNCFLANASFFLVSRETATNSSQNLSIVSRPSCFRTTLRRNKI